MSPIRWQRAVDRLTTASRTLTGPLVRRAERVLLNAASRPELSRLMDTLADARLPRPVLGALIRAFAASYHIDLSEAADPVEAYETFNAFFTRRLRRGARPVDPDPSALVSPADARLQAHGLVDPRGRIPEVKGRRFSVRELLGPAVDPTPFERGTYAVLYLSPRDYHRVHSPASGALRQLAPIDGACYPVNALGRRLVPGLLAVNKRLVFIIDSAHHGPLAVVMVGATNVGRITTALTPGATLSRGDELGVFNLGSTVVLLTADHRLAIDGAYGGQLLKVGEPLVRAQA